MIVDLQQFLAALPDEVLAEAVAPEHLEQQPSEIAETFLAELQEGTALTAQDTRGRERAPRPTAVATKDRAHAVPLKCSRAAPRVYSRAASASPRVRNARDRRSSPPSNSSSQNAALWANPPPRSA